MTMVIILAALTTAIVEKIAASKRILACDRIRGANTIKVLDDLHS